MESKLIDNLNENRSTSSPGQSNKATDVLTERKNLIGHEIIAKMTESENLWRIISGKQTSIHQLYADQINVSDKFTRYNELWVNRDYTVSTNIQSFHQFTEIDEQVQLLSQYLDDFERKLFRSGRIVKDLIREIKNNIAMLRQSMESVIGANCSEDLDQVELPPSDWIHRYPDPQVEILLDEWQQLMLDDKISGCLDHLVAILESHSVTEEAVDSNI